MSRQGLGKASSLRCADGGEGRGVLTEAVIPLRTGSRMSMLGPRQRALTWPKLSKAELIEACAGLREEV
jgi:hypothetical protein